jgi:hypothetical protein
MISKQRQGKAHHLNNTKRFDISREDLCWAFPLSIKHFCIIFVCAKVMANWLVHFDKDSLQSSEVILVCKPTLTIYLFFP